MTQFFSSFFKRRRVRTVLFLLLAVLMGGLVSLDHWIVLVQSPQVWGGFVVPILDTHRHVLFPQARDILDGHLFFADTQLFEYRDGFPMTPWPWLPPVLYAVFWKLFGSALYLPLSTLIVAAASFLILATLVRDITRRWSIGIVAAILTFCARLVPLMLFSTNAGEFRNLAAVFLPTWVHGTPERVDFLPYESFNPTWLILGPTLLLLHRALAARRYRLLPWVGLLGGLLIYCYPFHWIWVGAVLGILLCGALLFRRWDLAGWTFAAIGINLVATIPFWANQYLLAHSGILADINLRNAGFELGRFVRWSQWKWYVLWAVLAAVVWRVSRRRGEEGTAVFLAVLFTALIACLNLQVVTNQNIHPDHWIGRISFLPVGWSLWYLFRFVWEAAERRRWIQPVFVAFLVPLALAGPVWGAVQDRLHTADWRLAHPVFSRDVWNAYAWINEHTERDAVVLANSVDVQSYLTIYTAARSFLPYGLSTFALEPEVRDRWFFGYALAGIPAEMVEAQLRYDHAWRQAYATNISETDFELREALYWVRWRSQEFDGSLRGYSSSSIPPQVLAELMAQYGATKPDIEAMRQRYRLDYVLSTEFDQRAGTKNLVERTDLQEVFRSGEVVLYRVLP